MDPRCEHNELAVVRDRHARAVDALVPEPRRLELVRVEVHNDFVERRVQELEVHLERELCGAEEARVVVANEDAARHELASRDTAADHSLDVHDREVLNKVRRGVVEDPPQRVVGAAHHALHAVDCANEVREVDRVASASADKEVLVVVRHAEDFVRHDLADRQDEVVLATPELVGRIRESLC